MYDDKSCGLYKKGDYCNYTRGHTWNELQLFPLLVRMNEGIFLNNANSEKKLYLDMIMMFTLY
jgi:hypothetical protein